MEEQSKTQVPYPGETEPDRPQPLDSEHLKAARRQARQDPLLIRAP